MIAMGLLILFGATNVLLIIIAAYAQAHKFDFTAIKELAEILLPGETALLGSAIGYYYAAAQSSDR